MMASPKTPCSEITGELLIAWQKYIAQDPDEITLKEGDVVELLETEDSAAKRLKLDPDFEAVPSELLDNAAARHKRSLKPRRSHTSSRFSPNRLNLNARWLVREISGSKKQGWVPCKVLQSVDDPTPGTAEGLPGDALFRRQAVVKELVETEQEFVKDLDYVVHNYLILSETGKVPKIIRDNCELIFGNLKEIAEFHRTVLMEGVRYYANEPHLLGKAFLRLERDFDKHVDYYMFEPQAQSFLESCEPARDYFDELSQKLGDDKIISEHLKLPIQRINDYQLLLKELVRYSTCLGEDSGTLQKALELMLSVPHRAQDEKFTSNIEGYRGSIHKLGRLLAHDWFSLTTTDSTKERYLFLFKGRILVCKVRRISDDRSVFQLKDTIQLERITARLDPEQERSLVLTDTQGGQSLALLAHRDHIIDYWLKEIQEFAVEDEMSRRYQSSARAEGFSESSSYSRRSQSSYSDEGLSSRYASSKYTSAESSLATAKVGEIGRRSSRDPDEGDYSFSRRSIKRVTELDDGDGYTRRSTKLTMDSAGGSEARRALAIDDELAKYSPAKYLKEEAKGEEDVYSRLERKYSRTDSSESKSRHRAEADEDLYAKYSRKYSRTDSAETRQTEAKERRTYVESNESSSSSTLAKEAPAPASDEERNRFIKTIRAANVEPGADVTLDVVLAKAPMQFSWLKDHAQVQFGARASQSCDEERHEYRLHIANARFEDSGHYTALALSALGEASCSALLTVHELTAEERTELADANKPEFIIKLKDTEQAANTYLRFMVKVRGDPNPDVLFFRDGAIIQKTERYQVVREHADRGFYELLIPEVSPADAGLYKCVASNTWGEEHCEATLTVTAENPHAAEMPEGEVLPPGETPAFHWKKDGVAFDPDERFKVLMGEDQDSLALVFQHVRAEDVGLYTCVAQTTSGHISCSAELTVHGTVNQLFREPEKPQLVVEKRDPVVTAGGSAMLELQVKGYPKPQVTWTHEGKAIEPGGKYKFLYEDEESMSLVIKDVQKADEGVYQCTAQNDLGTDSAELTLTVKLPPKITTKLGNIDQHAGLLLQIPVEVTGTPTPTVTFYKDGKELKSTERAKLVREPSGATTLIIEKTQLSDSGAYSVVATNELAQTAEYFNINIHSKPKVLERLGQDKIVSQSEEVELRVKLEAEPAPEVKWYKDGAEIVASDHYLIKSDAGSYILKITGAVTTDAARYKLKASNSHGTIEDEVKIDVKKAPKITKGLQDMTVNEHDKDIVLDVQVESFPRPTVKWYLDEVEITETRREFTRVEYDDGAKLVIKEVASELSGRYTCKLSNECGGTETSAKLTVNCAPRIIKQLKDTTVEEGATLHLEVEVEGTPEPVVKWLKNGREVSADARIKITRDSHRQENYHLAVDLIKYEEQGEYEVIVTNAMGTVSSKSFVTVHKEFRTDAVEIEEEEEEELARTDDKITAEPIIEEPTSPQVTSLDIVEESPIETEPQYPVEVPPPTTKSKRAKSIQIEEIEEVPSTAPPVEVPVAGLAEAKPTILESDLSDKTRPESLAVSFLVRGTANPAPTATWSLNGRELKPDDHLRISCQGDEYKLEILKLEMGDAGTVTCTLSNPLGETKQQAVLSVTPERELRRPKLKQPLVDQTIVKKNSVTFTAVVVGDPVPNAIWSVDGHELSDEEFERYKIILETEDHEVGDGLKECRYSLTVPRCERTNAGNYKLVVGNKWGQCESSAQLTIVLRPEITGLQNVSVVPGEAVEFVCRIQANPLPKVEWMKNQQVLNGTEFLVIIEDVPNETYRLVFKSAQLSDEGYYAVSARNELGDDTAEARLKAVKDAEPSTEKPTFITGLSDEHLEHLKELSVMVRADGLPKPVIRWYLNDQPITADQNHSIDTHTDAQVTSTLTVSNFNDADSGLYKAVAANCAGDEETTARIVMIQTPPSFGRKLERTEDVKEGEPLELRAKISGSPKPTVAWFKNGEPITDPRVLTSFLPDGSVKLSIESAKPSDSGAYKLVIGNTNGENSCLCAVAVQPKSQRPKFLKCFKDAKLSTGEPLRLEATVQAYPPPDIKWLKDGVPVRASPNLHFEVHPDGKLALIVDSARPESAGKYELIVSNKLGDAMGEASIEVQKRPVKPEFLTRLEPQAVVEGFPVKFEVKAAGFPAPKITWSRNGAEVISDPKHVKITELPDGSSVLVLDHADAVRDAITYRAIAVNEAGEAETSALLTVKPVSNTEAPEAQPLFLQPLKDVRVDEGEALVLSAPFTANPIPTVEWSKDGHVLEPSDRVLITCDGAKVALELRNATPGDSGEYRVLLTNPLGSESSQAKGLVHKIFMTPSFTQKFTDLQQLPGRDAKFPCRVSGVPQPEVTWSKDGLPIHESEKFHIKRDGDLCCLYVLNCDHDDAAVYRAAAVNKEGEDICTASLEVVDQIKSKKKIEPPSFLKKIGDLELYKGMVAKFTACAAGFPEPEATWYLNDQKLFPSNRIQMETDNNGLLRLIITGITEDDLGRYSCKITNEHGGDICHASLSLDGGLEPRTKRPITDQYTEFDKYKKTGAPVPLSDAPIVSQMTDRHCTLSWRPSIPSAPRAPVTYQLEMCEVPHGDWFTVRTGIRSCACGVRNLEPFRDYKFRVRVENPYGISEPSPYATTHRSKLEPEVPKFRPYLPPEIDFRPETSPYFPKDFDIERPPHDGMAQAPRFLRQEHDTQYGVKDQNTNLFWFVYGYPKPNVSYYFNDELIESGGRFDMSYTRNGQATLFINKMLDRDVGWYEAVARNEHGEARQRVRLEIAELPTFLRRPDIQYALYRDKVRFEARIIGVPYPELKWYKDWKPLATSSRIKIQRIEPDITVLVINDAISKDEGLYSVSARNVAGCASSSAMLYVEESDLDYNLHTYRNVHQVKPRKKDLGEAYDLGDELGRGTQGVTYHAAERATGRSYAAKVMHGRGDLKPLMYNELEALNNLRHRNLVGLHDAYETNDTLALILELGSGGELVRDHLLKHDSYTERDIAGYVKQILNGLLYMHERGYAHLGLNLGDLLLAHPGADDLKISDFGLTRKILRNNLHPLHYGVPEYASPECVNKDGVGYGHDMWSLGIITYILLSGHSPFRGADDRETLTRVQAGKWTFDDEWWINISTEARDFISKLLVYGAEDRMDVHAALRHPWFERYNKTITDEYQISSKYLHSYYRLYREWYDNASCKRWFRWRKLETAFTHPSRMVYPPGEYDSPRPTPVPIKKAPRLPTWEDALPTRSPLNYEIGAIKSESHYQSGPDTYLLQLRDVDFPVRLREYMKVAGRRGPATYIVSDENGFDWRTPTIRERRRFTDIMDEEIDDERRARINRYGAIDNTQSIRRLKHEIGARLDTYVEAEAFLESRQEGRLPFFREKPQVTAMVEGTDMALSCLAVGDPRPIVQWFKNDTILAESHRIKVINEDSGRSHLKFKPALSFDQGLYKVVARNKIGQTVARARIVYGCIPDEPDSPEASQISDTEIYLVWRQPKFDGNAPVLCYSLEYKLADATEWTKAATNIDHEFYLLTGLAPNSSYMFRLAAHNNIGWSEFGVPSGLISTKAAGAKKLELSAAVMHLQRLTDSGQEVGTQGKTYPDYGIEAQPVEWTEAGNVHDNYNFISEISKGQFSAVLKAIDKQSNTVVVAKVFDQSPSKLDDVEGEFAAARSLRHERIASLIAAYKNPSVFIMEKLQGADILTFLASKHEYSEQTVATIVTQILDGLQYLHWRGLCHLDLQPDNIVMTSLRSVQVKLVDFGAAHRVTKLGVRVPVVGHRHYISPEVLTEEPAYPQTDIWTVGVLTYIMLSGVVPFRGQDENETKQNIAFVRYRFEHLYQEISQEATRFIMLLFKRQPNKRPSAEECHENRWLSGTDFMIKKRERAVFLGNRLKGYADEYHAEKAQSSQDIASKLGGQFNRSQSIQEELSTAC